MAPDRAWSFSVKDRLGCVLFDQPDSEVNILTSENLFSLEQLLQEIAHRNDLDALLIASAKSRVFIAGADIKEIEAIVSAEDAFKKAESGKAIFKKLEDLKIPTVCVINGACLGGGAELALSCRYRVASFSPNVKIGFPEVNLGILPGFGGSVRLPRLVGLLKALPLILTGRLLSAEEGLRLGLVDKLFPEKTLLEDAAVFARHPARKPPPNSVAGWFFEQTPLGRTIVFSKAKKEALKKTKGHYPAPLEILKLLRRVSAIAPDAAFRLESEHFSRLAITLVSKNLIKAFYLGEKYKKMCWTDSAVSADGVKKCGVIGAGVMGGGIAQLFSSRDIPVRVKDVQEKALGGALKEAAGIYRDALKKRKLKRNQVENKMALISVGLTNAGLRGCGLIVEAVVEDLGIKQKVFRELSELTGPETILASNTSSLPVTRMAEGCRNPERILGLHFFNPVNRMPLVEVIRAARSSSDAIERAVLFVRRIGKTAIVVQDSPGFLVNRLLLPYMNEAAYLLSEGFSPSEIDRLIESFGMPMGPIELIDQVGIDVGYKVAHVLQEAFGERMKVSPILQMAKEKGLLGKKSKKGFYLYDGKRKTSYFNALEFGVKPCPKDGSLEDPLKRMIYAMINEASRCLEDKIVDSASTVDIGMMMGAGFPPFRGGLLRYADSIGPAKILKDLERFQKNVDAKRFEPSAYLRLLASEGRGFHS